MIRDEALRKRLRKGFYWGGLCLFWGLVFSATLLFWAWYSTILWFTPTAMATRHIAVLVVKAAPVVAAIAGFVKGFWFVPDPDALFGSARWANRKELDAATRLRDGLLVGRDPVTKKLLRYDGPAHLLTMAPTRTGKGVGTIIPNLLTLDRSVICIDPKGENAKVTLRARERFGPVHVLDPFGVTGRVSDAFNPLDRLDPFGLDVADDAGTLADALIADEPGQGGEAHWNEEAKALVTGLLLHIVADEPPQRRTLATLREDLTLAPAALSSLLKTMQASPAVGGLVARAANRHLGKSDREAAGVLSVAQRHTHFLDSPRMTAVLDRSDFSFADLKRRTATVFLVLPPDRLSTYARWLRLLVAQSLLDVARDPTKPEAPILYLLDEFAALGHLAPVERAMGLMAGYGVQLWPILQDVHQLRATYGARAGTFLSNAGVLQLFGVNDLDTADWIARAIGKTDVRYFTDSYSEGRDTFSEHVAAGNLINPDEIMRLPETGMILMQSGKHPAWVDKIRYYADREFRGVFDEP